MIRNMHPESGMDGDPDYRDFIDSISVSQEELYTLVSVPEVQSIEQARDYVRNASGPGPSVIPTGWLARGKEKLAGQTRHLMTALNLAMVGLRHSRNHRHT